MIFFLMSSFIFIFLGSSHFVSKNRELPFQNVKIKLCLKQVSSGTQKVTKQTNNFKQPYCDAHNASVMMVRHLPDSVNAKQLKAFLIYLVKERKIKVRIGDVSVHRCCGYVEMDNQQGMVVMVGI